MLGMTLAAPAAQALTSFVLTGERPAVLSPFRATRFRARAGKSVRTETVLSPRTAGVRRGGGLVARRP
jgi:D-amino-acid dehydrogenase